MQNLSLPNVRAPAVAGTFYPADAAELRRDVLRRLARADVRTNPPKAIVAPHSRYADSGAVAASAFASVAPLRGRVSRVVLIGPAHRSSFRGVALPEASAFATPLGLLHVDEQARRSLRSLPQVIASDRAHAGEHTLEVQLPFVQEVLGPDVHIVPLLVGNATDYDVAGALTRVWGGPETLVVVSSDLSHYLSYEEARAVDGATASAIERLLPDELGPDSACGRASMRALLLCARAHGLRAETLDLRSSGDTAGVRDEVVGYGAFALS